MEKNETHLELFSRKTKERNTGFSKFLKDKNLNENDLKLSDKLRLRTEFELEYYGLS